MLGITHLEAQDLLVCAQRTLAGGSKRGALRGELVLKALKHKGKRGRPQGEIPAHFQGSSGEVDLEF